MKIDSTVEPLVREAFAASVAGEPKRFETALDAIASRGDEVTSHALALALAVDHMALLAVHSGQRPDDTQMDYLAQGLAEDAQDWAPSVTSDAARSFLDSVADATPTPLSAGDLAELAFGAGGWLLSSFQPDDKKWTQFLDEILNVLEAAPDQP
jgi:hypothetical protein